MNYVFLKHPSLRLDLVIDAALEPQLVSYIERMGCTYDRETVIHSQNGRIYKALKDVQGSKGAALGELLGLFYSLEWGNLTEGEDRKFWIMVNPRRKEKKKHAGTDRKTTGKGSDGGNSGESSCDPGPGEMGGPAGDGPDDRAAGADDLWELPRVE